MHTEEREAELEAELERETQAAAQEAALEARAAAADDPRKEKKASFSRGNSEAKQPASPFTDSDHEEDLAGVSSSDSGFAVFATAAEAKEAARAAAAAAAAVGNKPLGPPQPPVIPVVDTIDKTSMDYRHSGSFHKRQARAPVESSSSGEISRLDQQSIEHRSRVVSLVNGTNSYDAICAELWRSPAEVDLVLRYDKSIVILHK